MSDTWLERSILTRYKTSNHQGKDGSLRLYRLRYLLLLVPFILVLMGGPVFSAVPVQPSLYLGVHVPGELQSMSAVTAFEQQTHKSVSIVMWYQGWGLQDGTQNFQTTWMNNVRNHGSIPLVTWEPWLYTKGVNQPAFSLESIINGSHDAYIIAWAKASKAWGHPYFLRFAHEMNGNWYPWSEQANGNKAGQYVKAWQHVHNIFRAQGVKNVTWVWSPNTDYAHSIPLKELYPGSAYVDWVAMDGYNWGNVNGNSWLSFRQVFQQTYNNISALANNKPLMIAETASAEHVGNKASWISDALTVELPRVFPRVKAVIWFDENKETDWRTISSHASQIAFAKAVTTSRYASNTYSNIKASPIPIPGK